MGMIMNIQFTRAYIHIHMTGAGKGPGREWEIKILFYLANKLKHKKCSTYHLRNTNEHNKIQVFHINKALKIILLITGREQGRHLYILLFEHKQPFWWIFQYMSRVLILIHFDQ